MPLASVKIYLDPYISACECVVHNASYDFVHRGLCVFLVDYTYDHNARLFNIDEVHLFFKFDIQGPNVVSEGITIVRQDSPSLQEINLLMLWEHDIL